LLLGISLEILPYRPPGGRALLGEFLADKGVSWHRRIKTRSGRAGNSTLREKKRPNWGSCCVTEAPMRRNATAFDSCHRTRVGITIGHHGTVRGASIGDRETGRAPAPAGGMSWAGKNFRLRRDCARRPTAGIAPVRSRLVAGKRWSIVGPTLRRLLPPSF
jgi:hypothetical protein